MRDLRFLLKTHYGASHALIIGINEYAHASPLSYAVSDALAIKEILVTDFNFKEKNVALLTDANATRHAILQSFLRLAADDVALDDRVIVFFAGHGHTRTGGRGDVGFLVPHDGFLDDLSTLIRWDELTRNADMIRAKHMLFVMDACYGGLALVRSAAPGSMRFLKDMMLRTSRQVLTAGKADEVVADSGGPVPDHSIFTGHLIQALKGKAATSDGVITASAVMSYIYMHVSRDKNSNQTPHFGHFDGDGDMILFAPELGVLEESDTKDIDRLVYMPVEDSFSTQDNTYTKIGRVKGLIASEAGAIELHDFLSAEVRHFLSATTEDMFAPSVQYSIEALIERLKNYETTVADLSLLFASVAQWGKTVHLQTLQKCIARSSDRLESQGGISVWLALRWYPLIIGLYSAGIAALDARRYDSLAIIFNTQTFTGHYQDTASSFVEAASEAILQLNRQNVFKQIQGYERNYTPMSDYLLKILQPQLDDLLFLGKDYENVFDSFEVFFALCVVDASVVRGDRVWAPVGRFGWKRGNLIGPLDRIIKEAESHGADWPPLKAGLFGGELTRFTTAVEKFSEFIKGLHWF